MINRGALYIDGQWIKPATGEVIEVDEAATEEIIGTVPAGDAADAERAILAARRSFDDWSQTPINERADVVQALADGLRANEAELARIMAQEVGSPIAIAERVQRFEPDWRHFGPLTVGGHPRHPSRLSYGWSFASFGAADYLGRLSAAADRRR